MKLWKRGECKEQGVVRRTKNVQMSWTSCVSGPGRPLLLSGFGQPPFALSLNADVMYMLPKTAAVAAKKSENRGEIAACSLANCRSPFPSFPPSRVPIALLPPPSQIASMRGYFPSHVPRFILGWSAPRTGLADVSCGEL